MARNRCADYKMPFVLAVVCCYLITTTDARAQFSNMRVFRTSGMFSKDHWRPLDILKSFKMNRDEEVDSSSRAAEIVSASSIKRVSMAALLQQLNQAGNGKKEIYFPKLTKNPEEFNQSIPVAVIESNPTTAPPVVSKESPIRRIKLPAGSISYSRNGPGSKGPAILININPHLQRSTRIPSTEPSTTTNDPKTTTTEPTTTTTELTTTTTTEPSTTTTAEPTTTEPCVTKIYIKAKTPAEKQAGKINVDKAKTPAAVRSSPSSKKLSQMPNSPIYYIKLPVNSFVSGRTPFRDDSPDDYFKQSPVFVATTRRPGSAAETETTDSSSSDSSLSTTTLTPPRTNSRVINIKGPFVFNGKPGGIYSAPAPYRPPNYLDLLHQIYPKLKRAQFIRR
ncbi:hypothetical protein GHT06_017677 [Daphnia sinensis]|uniref:Uncharacterized protein n=1 Tax=Daphnia sinensis TaxID=1820382 RepID=A0AAD5KLI0_9CRUS|nr:hypothetical protein GHT06_017677 [Daphnia sinensis]